MCIKIDFEGAEAADASGRGGRLATAQHRRHARQQFAVAEGFGQIVVGPDFEADDAVNLLAARREHDDRRAAAAKPARQAQTILSRQHDIEQDQIDLMGGKVPFHG
jgi:hypothetical protein